MVTYCPDLRSSPFYRKCDNLILSKNPRQRERKKKKCCRLICWTIFSQLFVLKN